jgi:hypothetical protein
MIRKHLLVACAAVLALMACGGGSKSEGTNTSSSESQSGGLRAGSPCLTNPTPIGDPKFPSPFPEIDDVTWTSSTIAGPSLIVEGYTGDDLTDLFREMQEKFATNGYSVTKSEKDPHDAEVNFASAANTGQVRLAEECQGRNSVTITIRPA